MTELALPGYTLLRTLGKGGMATVYLAMQEKFEREVALKVMAPALSADAGFRERFLREAKIVARISHPNIVAVYDVNEVDGVHYIAMEYHPGGDLKSRLREGIGLREALAITKDVARALAYAHSKGYVHRDIKPDNILFRVDGSAVLTDFGIAKATEGDANLTQIGMVAGTPKYMSPEQARGQTLEGAADLYSLGVVLHEMLTGRLPYEAADPIALGILHMNAPVPRLEGRLAHFQPLLDRLLAKNPAQRPQSGAELIRDIEALEKGFDFERAPESATDSATVLRPTARPRPAPAADDAATVIAPSVPAATALAPPAVAAETAPASTRKLMGVGAALVLAVGGLGLWWGMKGETPPVPAVAPATTTGATPSAPAAVDAVTTPVPEVAPAPSPAPAVKDEAPHQQAKPAPAPSKPAADDPLLRLRVSGLLGAARQALDEGDAATAAERYREVLKLDPQNREARNGLRQSGN
ncbi:MAG: serine/threonine-protein kinase [Moraxellaceae bacterium]